MRPFKRSKIDDSTEHLIHSGNSVASIISEVEGDDTLQIVDNSLVVEQDFRESVMEHEVEELTEHLEHDLSGSVEEDSGAESDGSGESDESEETAEEEWVEEVLTQMEDCLEDKTDKDLSDNKLEDVPRVILSQDQIREIKEFLWEHGPFEFLEKYVGDLDLDSEDNNSEIYSCGQLLSALGFALPVATVEKYGLRLKRFLPTALKHFLSARRRLPYPRTMDDFCKVLRNATRVLVITGAGISTSLGIPDFRSKSGLYNKLEHLGLSDPQEVFDIHLFRYDPSIFYSIAREILPQESGTYTPTHAFIKLLEDHGKLLRNYTQNIDNLESNAGIPPDKLVQCHGSFGSATCQTCGYKCKGEDLFDDIRQAKVAQCPQCTTKPLLSKQKKKDDDSEDDTEELHGVMKPDITFFGEALPTQFDDLLFGPQGDAQTCDLVICIGTSLKVAPVSEIIRLVPGNIPQVYINKTLVSHNEFDITFLGNCDDVVEWVSQEMQWELNHEMNKRTKDYESTEFPGGKILYFDDKVVYKFDYDEEQQS